MPLNDSEPDPWDWQPWKRWNDAGSALWAAGLERRGSPAAVACLEHIARSARRASFRVNARDALIRLAEGERAQVADFVEGRIPELGFDGAGRRVCRAAGAEATMQLEPDGQLSAVSGFDAPSPELREVCGRLHRQTRQVLTEFAHRLEDALVTGHDWTEKAYRSLFGRHPIGRIVKRALFFEDGATGEHWLGLASPPVGISAVRLLHPVWLSESERLAALARLEAHGLTPLFPQLTRSLPPPMARRDHAAPGPVSVTDRAGLERSLRRGGWHPLPPEAGGEDVGYRRWYRHGWSAQLSFGSEGSADLSVHRRGRATPWRDIPSSLHCELWAAAATLSD